MEIRRCNLFVIEIEVESNDKKSVSFRTASSDKAKGIHMSLMQIMSLLVVLAALFGFLNWISLKLPNPIGILVFALAASLTMIGIDAVFPAFGVLSDVRRFVTGINFSTTLLEGMLGVLLFAGALHVNLQSLKNQAWAVLLLATIGVAVSTLVAGIGFSFLAGVPILIALVFGALISPTDPVAVLGILRNANLPRELETKIAGESLFNDGMGYVVFLALVTIAFPSPDAHGTGLFNAVTLFLQEAVGGALLGILLGWLTFEIMKNVNDPSLEVLVTLALVLGGSQLAASLHVSMPIMAVTAGLLIGDVGMKHAMSRETREYVNSFWQMIDELLNAVLFLLIGIEVLVVTFGMDQFRIVIFGIVLALAARLFAVAVPVLLLRPFREFYTGVIPIMTWGGLKGGISVALALSLPESEWKPIILTVTYSIVIFSILVQGLTIGSVAKQLTRGGNRDT